MGSWLDKWAKRAATAAPTDVSAHEVAPSSGSTAASSSRRDFLKKAGIVGGVAWSVPVIQTVAAPMASASHGGGNCSAGGGTCGTVLPGHTGPCSLCANGVACGTAGDCSSNICSTTCKAAFGQTCTANAQCASNRCGAGGAGPTCLAGGATRPCSTNADCYGNAGCNGGTKTCNASTNGGTCLVSADCANSVGGNNCGQGSVCGGKNGYCTANSQCISNDCNTASNNCK